MARSHGRRRRDEPPSSTRPGGSAPPVVEHVGSLRPVRYRRNPVAFDATSSLLGLWFAGVDACEAVGSSGTSLPDQDFAESWDGPTWTAHSVANPAGTYASYLAAVACLGTAACEAVGNFTEGVEGPLTLAERWDRTTWTVQPTPIPPGSSDLEPGRAHQRGLETVSCSGPDTCEAVGNYNTSLSDSSDTAFAERWDGTTWTLQSVPAEKYSYLESVSCTQADACEAVGTIEDQKAIAEAWNGTDWIQQSTANVAATPYTLFLHGVCRVGPDDCEAVGSYDGTTDSIGVTYGLTLAEVLDGATWRVQSTPNPVPDAGGTLEGVSCSAANACETVGSVYQKKNRSSSIPSRSPSTERLKPALAVSLRLQTQRSAQVGITRRRVLLPGHSEGLFQGNRRRAEDSDQRTPRRGVLFGVCGGAGSCGEVWRPPPARGRRRLRPGQPSQRALGRLHPLGCQGGDEGRPRFRGDSSGRSASLLPRPGNPATPARR